MLTFQDNDLSTWRVEAYMRTPEFVQGRCPVKRVIYMRLPHPAVHENHGQYQVRSISRNVYNSMSIYEFEELG